MYYLPLSHYKIDNHLCKLFSSYLNFFFNESFFLLFEKIFKHRIKDKHLLLSHVWEVVKKVTKPVRLKA